MYLTAVNTAIIKALEQAIPVGLRQLGRITPESVGLAFPLEEQEWPAIIVKFIPDSVEWAGLIPTTMTADNKTVREGISKGTVELRVVSTSPHERDAMCDSLAELIMVGRTNPTTSTFYTYLEDFPLVDIVILESVVNITGLNDIQGTPWSDRDMSFEGTIRLSVWVEFRAMEYEQTWRLLSAVEVYQPTEEIIVESVPPPDGEGPWQTY